jgi:hypothetical protein
MKSYLKDWIFCTGFVGLVLGTGPLIAIILLAKIGLWPDPDPNPIGPGLLSFFTLLPSILLMSLGARRVRQRRRPPFAS